MILVTGATGNVGKELVEQLVGAGQPVRVFTRNPGKLAYLGQGVEIAAGDLDQPETIEAALKGVKRIFLVTSRTQQDAHVIEAARRNGVEHVVKLSTLEAADDSMAGHVRWHREREELIQASGLAWTFLRPTMFMTTALDWAGTIKAQGVVYYPGGAGKVPPVDPWDVAAVAACALTGAGHEGAAYALTGPEALSLGDMTHILGDVLGRSLRYVDVPESDFAAELGKLGLPDYVVEGLIGVFSAIRAGKLAHVTETVQRVTGRPARTFETWCRKHRSAFE
jgi:uncharacterized protein YbjT (DUF2867 family)